MKQIRQIKEQGQKLSFNKVAKHPLQSWEWGEFRQKTGIKVQRWGLFEGRQLKEAIQVTIHPLPKGKWTIGYFPKGEIPSRDQKRVLEKIAKKENCIFIKLEPKVELKKINQAKIKFLKRNGFVKGRSLFTPYNFILDLSPSLEELLKNFKSKTRYNIRLAQRKGVEVKIDNSDEAFEFFLKLMKETTQRQGFYAHEEDYYREMWATLQNQKSVINSSSTKTLKADLMVAKYKGEIITAWMLFWFGETMYYPYGASTRKYREVMANNLVMWEAIKLAKKRGCNYFDMWGALGPNPSKNDPWYGFHRFKSGYNPNLIEYMGTYDLVFHPFLYKLFRLTESLRWKWLKLKTKLRLRRR